MTESDVEAIAARIAWPGWFTIMMWVFSFMMSVMYFSTWALPLIKSNDTNRNLYLRIKNLEDAVKKLQSEPSTKS